MLRVELRKRRGDFTLDVAFSAPTPGVTALVRPLRLRQVHADLADRGSAGAGLRPRDDRRRRAVRQRAPPVASMRAIGASAWCSRTRGCFRTCRCAAISTTARGACRAMRRGPIAFDDVVGLLGLDAARGAPPARAVGRRKATRRARAARCCRNRGCCCSTSRWPRSTWRGARRCCPISRSCATRSRFRSST